MLRKLRQKINENKSSIKAFIWGFLVAGGIGGFISQHKDVRIDELQAKVHQTRQAEQNSESSSNI